jgi:nicotinamidase-related amidase
MSTSTSTSSAAATALLIIDVQNDFLPPSGSLAVPDGGDVLPIISGLLKEEWMEDVWDIVVASQVSGKALRSNAWAV